MMLADDVLVPGVVVEGVRVQRSMWVEGVVMDGDTIEGGGVVDGVVVDGLVLFGEVAEGFEIGGTGEGPAVVDHFVVDGVEVEGIVLDGDVVVGDDPAVVDGLIMERFQYLFNQPERVSSGVFVAVRGIDTRGVSIEGTESEELCGWPGPLCPREKGVEAIDEGGRLWWTWGSRWDPWVGQVMNLCDDHEALLVRNGTQQGGFLEHEGVSYLDLWIDANDRKEIAEARSEWRTNCDNPSGASLEGGYSYVASSGPIGPYPSVREAVRAYQAAADAWRDLADPVSYFIGHDSHRWPLGSLMGSLNYEANVYRLGSRSDEVVVRAETVSVIDGVVRGLAQNRSERLWARNVAVTATDASGNNGVWRYPLSVQPGEVLPLEITDWHGFTDADKIRFTVSSDLSPTIDLSRSLELRGVFGWSYDGGYIVEHYPEELWGNDITDLAAYYPHLDVRIERRAPASHPELADEAIKQTITNFAVYAATTDGGIVTDVFELTPMTVVVDGESERRWFEIRTIPHEFGDHGTSDSAAVAHRDENLLVWAGSTTDL